jgi:hypothetical protein
MDKLPDSPTPEAERKRIMRSRNIVVAVVLFGFAVLTFAISIAKMS